MPNTGQGRAEVNLAQLLAELMALCGPSGFEQDVARYIAERVKANGVDCEVDGLGNVIVRKRGAHPGPRLVVAAHMDEVGFIVKKIEENGLLRFEKVGGHDDRLLLAQKVRIRTDQGVVPGVIGTISAHMQRFDDVSRIRKYSELYIDIGAANRQEVTDLGVEVGNPITWANDFSRLGKSRATGKGFDDRAGCAVLIAAMEELDFAQVHGEVVFVFSTQEEIGLRGAEVAANQVHADVALAVDTTAVSDTFESMMDKTLALGAGAAIKVMDASLVASKTVWQTLQRRAMEEGIPFQLEVFMGIGTDAGALVKSQAGTPAGVISIPSRYAHSPVEVLDLADLRHCTDLLKAFIKGLRTAEEFRFI